MWKKASRTGSRAEAEAVSAANMGKYTKKGTPIITSYEHVHEYVSCSMNIYIFILEALTYKSIYKCSTRSYHKLQCLARNKS